MAKIQYSTFYYSGNTRVSMTAEDLLKNIREVERDGTFTREQKEAINRVFNVMVDAIVKENS